MGFDAARFVDEVDAELICSICHGVLEDPRQVHILKFWKELLLLLHICLCLTALFGE